MLLSILLAAAPLTQLPEPPENFGLSTVRVVEASSDGPGATSASADIGQSKLPPTINPTEQWNSYQAKVSSYLEEAVPPPPPPPGPPVAPPAEMGLSGAVNPPPATAAACDPYVNNLYSDACCCDEGGCGCLRWWKQHCAMCKLHSTCDLYPHYAYFPKYHGYYYFRPYNYSMVATQQQAAVRMGGDPRNPYSTLVLANLFRDVPPPPRSATKTRQQGPVLPVLDSLLDPKPAN